MMWMMARQLTHSVLTPLGNGHPTSNSCLLHPIWIHTCSGQLPATSKQTTKQKFKVWLHQGSEVETTKHTIGWIEKQWSPHQQLTNQQENPSSPTTRREPVQSTPNQTHHWMDPKTMDSRPLTERGTQSWPSRELQPVHHQTNHQNDRTPSQTYPNTDRPEATRLASPPHQYHQTGGNANRHERRWRPNPKLPPTSRNTPVRTHIAE